MTTTNEHRPFFTADDLVSSYTRAQAIADGVLIDVTETAKGAGWKWPVALTAAAWADFVAWSNEDTLRKGWPQDEAGRLWDVLWIGRLGIKAAGDSDRALFSFLRVAREGASRKAVEVQARIHCGPGDAGEPVITIMMPDED